MRFDSAECSCNSFLNLKSQTLNLKFKMLQTYISRSAADTFAFGQQLGAVLQSGALVALSGELGAGKTCCIQGIAAGLNVPPDSVTSPTYTLIHEYQGRLPLYHFDVYRLAHEDDLYDLGYEEYFYGQGVTVIEWAERIQAFLPDEHLAVHLHLLPDQSRRIEIYAYGRCSRDKLGALR